MIEHIVLTHRSFEGTDPIERLINTPQIKVLPIPFTITKLKQRHQRLLRNINPRYDHNESEGRCSSIDSAAYK